MKNAIYSIRNNSVLKQLAFQLVLIIGCFQFGHTQSVTSQPDSTAYVEVNLKDGASFIGELVAEESDHLIIKTASLGEITIDKEKVDSYEMLSSQSYVNGVYYHKTANSSRNIFAPTGYGLKKGEGYYQNFMIVVNQISYGITDYFSMGVGFEFVSILAGANSFGDDGGTGPSLPAFMITPKFSIPIKENKWNIGIGALALNIPDSDNLFDVGALYGVSTWGSENSNFTVGVGIGYTEDRISDRPLFTLSANHRLSKRIALVTENWIMAEEGETLTFNSIGARYLGDKVSVDFALVGAGYFGGEFNDEPEYGISPIPLLGLTIPFGEGWKK
ncbi:MAG: hypothetical protein AB8F74_13295 [Saprospiraceae bacterium]